MKPRSQESFQWTMLATIVKRCCIVFTSFHFIAWKKYFNYKVWAARNKAMCRTLCKTFLSELKYSSTVLLL